MVFELINIIYLIKDRKIKESKKKKRNGKNKIEIDDSA